MVILIIIFGVASFFLTKFAYNSTRAVYDRKVIDSKLDNLFGEFYI
jgi:hypothetical protein